MSKPLSPAAQAIRQLYVVEVTYSAYVWASSMEEAVLLKDQINPYEETAPAHEAVGVVLGWESDCLVYHKGKDDLPLRDVLVEPE